MALEASAAKPDNLRLISGTHMVGGQNPLPLQVVLWPPSTFILWNMCHPSQNKKYSEYFETDFNLKTYLIYYYDSFQFYWDKEFILREYPVCFKRMCIPLQSGAEFFFYHVDLVDKSDLSRISHLFPLVLIITKTNVELSKHYCIFAYLFSIIRSVKICFNC